MSNLRLGLKLLTWIAVALLLACNPQPTPLATSTPQPTATDTPVPPSPTRSATRAPTGTPVPPSPTRSAILAPAGTSIPLPLAAISPDNANRVVQLARWGKGAINQVVWSPDGRQLAIASSITVYVYDADLATTCDY